MNLFLIVFASTYVSVFTLGLQSLNVNQGRYWAAAATSLGIGAGHVFLYRFMPEADLLQLIGYFAGGVTGITSSMWVHARTLGRRKHAEQAAMEKRVADVVLARLLTNQYDRRTDIH